MFVGYVKVDKRVKKNKQIHDLDSLYGVLMKRLGDRTSEKCSFKTRTL